MAVGSSLADLMLSMISLFVLNSTLGLGTIIGSQIFNNLVISAACVMYAKNGELILQEGILTRSVIVYGLSLVCIMAVLHEGSFDKKNFYQCISVDWYSGLLLILAYFAYVYVVVNHEKICKFLRFSNASHENRIAIHIPLNPLGEDLPADFPLEETPEEVKRQKNFMDLEEYLGGKATSKTSELNKVKTQQIESDLPKARSVTEFRRTLSTPREPSECSNREVQDQPQLLTKMYMFCETCLFYMTYPIRFSVSWTIPDVKKENNRRHYALAAFLCVIWLALLAEGLLSSLEELSGAVGLDPVLTGLTAGAWGVSFPTLWGSVIVSKKGFGDMAISNGVGANVFSALIGLGLPWFTYPLYLRKPYDGIKDDGILPLLFLLLIVNIIYYFMLRIYNFTMKFW
jgi:Ca2+/Na+ antiporter